MYETCKILQDWILYWIRGSEKLISNLLQTFPRNSKSRSNVMKESVRSGPPCTGRRNVSASDFSPLFFALSYELWSSGADWLSLFAFQVNSRVHARDKLDRTELFLRSEKSIAARIYARHVWDYESLPSSSSSSSFWPRRLFFDRNSRGWKNLFRESRICRGGAW